MSAVFAGDVLRLVSGALQDLEPGQSQRWTWDGGQADKVGLLDFLNAAIRAVVLQRPDATAVTEPVLLEPGMRQRLPQRRAHQCRHDALTLIELVRNLGRDGETPGRAIALVNQDVLLAWANCGQTGHAVDEYAYDRMINPEVYWVYPAVPEDCDVWVEATFSAAPSPVSCPDDVLPVPGLYAPALAHHILASILSGDNEAANTAKATYHMQMFQNLMDVKQDVDRAWPKQRGGA